MTRLLAIALAVAFTVSCGSSPPPKPTAPVAAPVAVPVAPAVAVAEPTVDPDAPPAPEWSYSSAGKRDPFRSFMSDEGPSQGIVSRCTTPLGRFDMEQLRVVAVITGLDDPVAMVEAPDGVGYSLRRGGCVGKNGGVVSAVRTGEVVVAEWAIRADGTRDRTQTILQLPKEASLVFEE
jgi:type IV pilus assembly protein PilP